MDLPLFLGGTSNHFRLDALRTIGFWDAFNVTEDADLGLRLARCGYRVEALPSHTFEEAPLTLRALVNQRSRWMKGWMQTALTHCRNPQKLVADLGLKRTFAALLDVHRRFRRSADRPAAHRFVPRARRLRRSAAPARRR